MKVKLLKKLRKKFYITKTNDGVYIVEGSTYSSDKVFSDLDKARKQRRFHILHEVRSYYTDYSVLKNKRFN